MTDTLYNRIWETVGKKVGYGIDCDALTDTLMDIFNEEKKKGRPYSGPVRDDVDHQRRVELTRKAEPFSNLTKDFTPERIARIKEQSKEVAKYMAEELNEN